MGGNTYSDKSEQKNDLFLNVTNVSISLPFSFTHPLVHLFCRNERKDETFLAILMIQKNEKCFCIMLSSNKLLGLRAQRQCSGLRNEYNI